MSFLAPLFFLGLAALAVPIFIHLTQRERKMVVAFPSLMFLRKIPYESVQRRRIRDWLLLLLRLAALAAVVLAFARPFVRGSQLAAAQGGARDVVVLLDRSYSMGFGDTWARAQQAARQAVAGVTANDRLSLVLFADTAEVVVRSTPDRERVVAEVAAATPGSGATKYSSALKLAASLLAESQLPRREVVLVSDFQRGGWQPDATLRLPGGATLTPVPVEPADGLNLALTPVTIQRAPLDGQERVAITAGILNRGSQRAPDVAIELELDGRSIQMIRVTVEPQASATATFGPVVVPSANARFAVRLNDSATPAGSVDALARDNVFYFVVSPAEPLPTVILSESGRDEANLYLVRALAIGDAPRFATTTLAPTAVSADVLARLRLMVINDVAIDDALASRVMTYVEGGGGLLIAAGARSAWAASRAALLPASLGPMVDRTRGVPAKLSGIDYGHAVFEPFRAPRSGDFAPARFYSYRGIAAAKDASVLARFDTGEPALVARSVGRGRVVVFASTFGVAASDFPLKPVFLPFVHQLGRYLAGYREQAPWLTVGQVLDVSAAEAAAGVPGSGAPRVVLTPSGLRRDLAPAVATAPATPAGASQQAPPTSLAVELQEQGFYEVRRLGREAGPVIVAAANVDLAESNLDRMDPKELAAAVSGAGPAGSSGGPDVLPDAAQELAQRVWWYLLFAGILLLIAETVLAARASRASR